jgi:cytochrome c-type biogenesis protein CcmH
MVLIFNHKRSAEGANVMFWFISLSLALIAIILTLQPIIKHRVSYPKQVVAVVIMGSVTGLLIYYLDNTNSKLATQQITSTQEMSTSNPTEALATQVDIENLLNTLNAKLKNNPSDAQGWALLARTYFRLKRYRESIPAFEKASAMSPNDAQLIADYADALAMSNSGYFDPLTVKTVDRALNANPENIKALLLKATSHFNARQFTEAIKIWKKLLNKPDISDSVRTEASNGITESEMLMSSNKKTR